MKKYLPVAIALFLSYGATAQVERKTEKKETATESNVSAARQNDNSDESILQQLNLTEQQMQRIKEIRKADKVAKEKIESDAQLTSEQKQEKIRDLRSTGFKKIMSELNDDQRAKFKELIKEKRATKN